MARRLFIVAMLLVGGCSNCGGGGGPDDGGVPDGVEMGTSDDGGDARRDAATPIDSGDDVDRSDVEQPSGYDPSLADLGEPPTACELTIGEQADTADARFFIASHRLDPEDLESQEAFRETIHRQVFDHVLGCRHTTAPNVVVFPESMSLPMLAIGETAAAARRASTAEAALTQLALAVPDAFQFYGERFPDTAIGTRLLLARTDTVVRATTDTFAAIARRYDVWVSVTVDLPDYVETSDPEVIEKIADPDVGDVPTAHLATTSEVTNRQLLFAPDGTVRGVTHKTYVTLLELQQLSLTPGRFSDIAPMQTPWGRTGVVISKPAWMVDVQDRLDDLGTTVYLQPEAFAGGWTVQTKPEAPDRWEPDVFVQGGWNLIQRSSRGAVDLVPQLTGNFFDIVFDAQLEIVEHTARNRGAAGFVGQNELPGQALIGPWAIPDPVESDPTLTLEERRAMLREVGDQLGEGTAPDDVNYVETWTAYDVDTFAGEEVTATVQTHPSAAVGDDLWLAFSSGEVGNRAITVRRHTDPSAPAVEEFELAAPQADRIRPHLFIRGGQPFVLFEEMVDSETSARVSDPMGNSETTLSGPLPAYRPRASVLGAGERRVIVREIDGANRVHVDSGDVAWVAVEPLTDDRGALRSNQWDPDIAGTGAEVLVVWTDFKNWRWEIWGAYSDDDGASWSEPFAVAPGTDAVETFHSTPRVVAVRAGLFVVSWTDLRTGRPSAEVHVTTVDTSNAMPMVGASVALSETGDWAWRASAALDGGSVRYVWEAMNSDGSRSVETALFDPDTGTATATREVVRRLDARLTFPFVALHGASTWIGWETTPARSSTSEVRIVELQ